MYIHNNLKNDNLQNIRFINNTSLHRLGDMLSQLRNLQAVPTQSMNVDDFCVRMRQIDAVLSRCAKLVHKLITPKNPVIYKSPLQNRSISHSLNFRVSLALTLQALEIRGVSRDILYKTRQKLCASVEGLAVPPLYRAYRHVAFRTHNLIQ